jgi:cobyrinic acid a,c-diamide synthase
VRIAAESGFADLAHLCAQHVVAPREFHRTVVHGTPVQPAWRSIGSPAEGFVHRSVHASYLHLRWAGQPSIAARLVAAASGWPSREPLTRDFFT